MRMIASVKIDEDNLNLASDLIAKREFSKIVNYALRVYKKGLYLQVDQEILNDMEAKNLNPTQLLTHYKDLIKKKEAQYQAMKKELGE